MTLIDATPADYTPTIADVAALIRARTKDKNGNEVGTFTPDTRPTDAQAQEAIDHALDALHEKVGDIGELCWSVARTATMYGAAAEIELSYFPEQARADRSPYTYLLNRYEQLLAGVEQCVLGNLPSNGPDDDGGGPARMGTLDVVSGVVYDYYTGRLWPPIPLPAPLPPDPEPAP
jgi:hypothetical protein